MHFKTTVFFFSSSVQADQKADRNYTYLQFFTLSEWQSESDRWIEAVFRIKYDILWTFFEMFSFSTNIFLNSFV